MLIVDHIVGNSHDDLTLATACEALARRGNLERVHLSLRDAQRGHMRVTTDAGTEIGIDLERGSVLRDGDVLYRSPDWSWIVVAVVEPVVALAVRPARHRTAGELFAIGVRLGHVLGNQHWPIRVELERVLVPITVDRKAVETLMTSYGLNGVEWEFVTVDPGQVPATMPPVTHEHG